MGTTKTNFFKSSFAIFSISKSKIQNKKPDYVSYSYDTQLEKYSKEISSQYWYTKKGVYRLSNHWGAVRSCFWGIKKNNLGLILGFCNWKNFKTITTYCTQEEEQEYKMLPEKLIGANNIVYEFRQIWITKINNPCTPIDCHENHYSNIISIIDDLSWDIEKLIKMCEKYNLNE